MQKENKYKISGTETQILEITLEPGEIIRGEPDAVLYLDDEVSVSKGSGLGLFSGFKRMVSGDTFMITSFENTSERANRQIAFAAQGPGSILPFDLVSTGTDLVCLKGCCICSEPDVDFEQIRIQFSGIQNSRYVLQKLSGDGRVFLFGGGFVLKKELKEGEVLRIHLKNLLTMHATVSLDTDSTREEEDPSKQFITLTGPGSVYLQSSTQPVSDMKSQLPLSDPKLFKRPIGEPGSGN
jgi:uncharacterized protein (AIM24 family)